MRGAQGWRQLLPAMWLAAAPVAVLAEAAPAPAVIVKAPAGELRGAERDGIRSFLGIPYAQPPVGDLRWRPPQPLPAWSGTRDALQFGAE